MKVIITNTFKKSTKKLMRNQIKLIENAIDKIIKDPEIGEIKKGDLAGISVYKCHVQKQLMLLAYQYSNKEIALLSLSTHESFCRDLKNRL